jgi:hypothetical protein
MRVTGSPFFPFIYRPYVMKKSKLFMGLLAFSISALTAISFRTQNRAIDLYYINSAHHCVAAPCETVNHTNKACLVRVYSDSNCRSLYKGRLWASDGDQ